MKKQLIGAILCALATTSAQAAEWSYQGENGVEHWGEHFATCGEGLNQTPINIANTIEAELAPLHLDYQGKITSITNNGHTVQANISGKNELLIDGQAFTLKQFHFHTPSENTINNKQFPIEVHFVHANEAGQLAVVAVMFNTGTRGNETLSALTASLPATGESITLSSDLSPADLLPRERDYYRFNGSLTTPPCSEGVRWFVLKEPVAAGSAQESALSRTMGENARPVQPINARVILE
ncbi:carbonic anhydrase [Photobacterium aquae]|uniref:Carbonic anhydrase n=1 Tax=Photobacterium aquae TaxID=1195763 RepID=A0A0J1H481_9GAMM|nr:carbonic anhydrase family protein [Photobacterium aquae]KLV06570.1 carbonic anhydrase [Photobacterium aquae]